MIRLVEINGQTHMFDEFKTSKVLHLGSILDPFGNNSIRVVGTGFIEMNIKCFVHNPPPPEFKSCPECGTLSFPSNRTTKFLRNMIEIQGFTQKLNINITDQDDDLVRIRLTVPRLNIR